MAPTPTGTTPTMARRAAFADYTRTHHANMRPHAVALANRYAYNPIGRPAPGWGLYYTPRRGTPATLATLRAAWAAWGLGGVPRTRTEAMALAEASVARVAAAVAAAKVSVAEATTPEVAPEAPAPTRPGLSGLDTPPPAAAPEYTVAARFARLEIDTAPTTTPAGWAEAEATGAVAVATPEATGALAAHLDAWADDDDDGPPENRHYPAGRWRKLAGGAWGVLIPFDVARPRAGDTVTITRRNGNAATRTLAAFAKAGANGATLWHLGT